MASSFVTLSSCVSSRRLDVPARSSSAPAGFRRGFLKVNAVAKYEPAKVVPQGDKSFGSSGSSAGGIMLRSSILMKSAGGVLLPTSAVKFERYLTGEVLSTGADVTNVEKGKKVLFNDINAYEVDLGTDERHCFCKAGDLLAVVE